MSTPFVYAGAKPPLSLEVTITPETGTPLDLDTVTECSLRVRTRAGEETFWDTVIITQTVELIVAVHEFIAGEVPIENTLNIMPILTVPGGERPCEPFTLIVRR